MAATLVDVARDLYGLQPQDFTAARNARAQESKAADATLAKQIAALKKPSPAAWIVNLLARESTDDLTALLDVGEQMRTAQEHLDRDALRRLGGERRTAVTALARAGADLADGAGRAATSSVIGEVEQTLQAATSDPAAAAAVASGLLVRALRSVGYEPVDLDDAVAVPEPGSWPTTSTGSRSGGSQSAGSRSAGSRSAPDPVRLADVRRRKEAKREADRLEHEADTIDADIEALERRAHRLALRRASLDAEIAELREQLETAETALTALTAEDSAVADARTEAQRNAEESRRNAQAARKAADALDPVD
jgi:hypothetical protein